MVAEKEIHEINKYEGFITEINELNDTIQNIIIASGGTDINVNASVEYTDIYCPINRKNIKMNINNVDQKFLTDLIKALKAYKNRTVDRMAQPNVIGKK